MAEKTVTLPKRWSDFLLTQPESGMGYQIVSITLQNGTRIEDVAIIEQHIIGEIRGKSNVVFDPEKIAQIEVTHRQHNSWRNIVALLRLIPNPQSLPCPI